MILIWKGHGGYAPIAYIATCLGGTLVLAAAIPSLDGLAFPGGLALGAAVLWFLGRHCDARGLPNEIYLVRVKFWAIPALLLALFAGYRTTARVRVDPVTEFEAAHDLAPTRGDAAGEPEEGGS